ncbi:MAG: putative toxin-antitoxin system toxin component, PIN family [Planctomycetota bacterium]
MRIVLDTNVLISGVLFSGPPARILDASRIGTVQFVTSPEILTEYSEVVASLSHDFPKVPVRRIIEMIAVHAEMVAAPPLVNSVCADPDDDKFLACALAAGVKTIVSGDKHLLQVSGYEGIQVMRPSRFISECL